MLSLLVFGNIMESVLIFLVLLMCSFGFCPFFSNWYEVLHWVLNIKPTLHSWNKFLLVTYHPFYTLLGFGFDIILLRLLRLYSFFETVLVYSFLAVSLFGLLPRWQLIELVGNCFFLFFWRSRICEKFLLLKKILRKFCPEAHLCLSFLCGKF